MHFLINVFLRFIINLLIIYKSESNYENILLSLNNI